MARSLSNAKALLSVVTDTLSIASQRRGYAAASQEVASVAKGSVKKTTQKEAESAWVPDPVTGYYRPANHAAEIDVAELRAIFLKQKTRSQ